MNRSAESLPQLSEGAASRPWQALVIPGVLVLAVFVYVMHGTFLTLTDLWRESDSYGHGFLVFGVFLYLIYLRRKEMAAADSGISLIGLLITCGLLGVWFASRMLSVLLIEQVTFVLASVSLVWAMFGMRMAKLVSLPVLYLFCAVPFWSYLIPFLQGSTAEIATQMSRALGVPIYLESVYMTIPDGVFLVAQMCAGLSFLLAAISLGAFYALLNLRMAWSRIGLVLLSVVFGVAFNWIRVTIIVLIGHHSRMEHWLVANHIEFGWFLFVLVVLLVMICGRLLERVEERSSAKASAEAAGAVEDSERTSGAKATSAMAVACVLVLSVPVFASKLFLAPGAMTSSLNIPEQLGAALDWRPAVSGSSIQWPASLAGTDHEAAAIFSNGAQIIDLQIGYFAVQRQGFEAVNERHQLFDLKGWRRIFQRTEVERIAISPALSVNEYSLQNQHVRENRLLWWLYWVDQEFTPDRVDAKLLQLRSLASGNRSAAIVVISSPVVGGMDATREGMRDWLRESAEPLAAALRSASR